MDSKKDQSTSQAQWHPPKVNYTPLQQELMKMQEEHPEIVNRALYLSELILSEEMNKDTECEAIKTDKTLKILLILAFVFIVIGLLCQGIVLIISKWLLFLTILYFIHLLLIGFFKMKLRVKYGMREQNSSQWEDPGSYWERYY